MSRWPQALLGEVLEKTGQRDPSDRPNEEFSYIDITSINNETKTIVSTSRTLGADAPSRARKVVHSGDIIVSTVRPNLNAVAEIPPDLHEQICSTGFAVLRPSPKLNGHFLYAFVRSPRFVDYLVAKTRGANYPAVSERDVLNARFILPPIPEQERIVKILGQADEMRILRREADRRTADLIPSRFYDMFGDPATNPKGWPTSTLRELAIIDSPMVDPQEVVYENLPHIGADRIEQGSGRLLKPKTAKEDGLISGKFLFDERHLLYSKIRPNLRKVALPDFKGLCSADVYPLRPDPERTRREFLWALLLSDAFTEFACAVSARANIPKINRDELGQYRSIVPPTSLQDAFAQSVSEIRTITERQAESSDRLNDLFQSLLHRAFEGEL